MVIYTDGKLYATVMVKYMLLVRYNVMVKYMLIVRYTDGKI